MTAAKPADRVPDAAVVVGATGAVGGALVRELLASPRWTRVVAIVRRRVDAFAGLPGEAKLRLEQIDFADLEGAAARLAEGCGAAFCTVGVSQPSKMAPDEYHRIDVEYAGAFARGVRSAGAGYIALLSSVGADPSSANRYLRTKADAERAVTEAGVARTSLFRPSLLVTPEVRYGLQDRLSRVLLPLAAPLLPRRFHQVRVEDLGRAMRLDAEGSGSPGVHVLHYPDFVALLRSA